MGSPPPIIHPACASGVRAHVAEERLHEALAEEPRVGARLLAAPNALRGAAASQPHVPVLRTNAWAAASDRTLKALVHRVHHPDELVVILHREAIGRLHVVGALGNLRHRDIVASQDLLPGWQVPHLRVLGALGLRPFDARLEE